MDSTLWSIFHLGQVGNSWKQFITRRTPSRWLISGLYAEATSVFNKYLLIYEHTYFD